MCETSETFEYFAVIEGNVPFTSTTADVFFFALAKKNMDFLPQDSAVSCNLFMIQKGDIQVIFAGDCPNVRSWRKFPVHYGEKKDISRACK